MTLSTLLLSALASPWLPCAQQDAEAAFWKWAGLNAEQRAWVEKTLASLSVRELTGQMQMAWVPGSYAALDSEDFQSFLEDVEGGCGSLWVMGGLPHARAAKINALQARAKVPLLVTGGGTLGVRAMGSRHDAWMFGGGTDLPSAMAYAAAGDVEAVRAAGRILGAETVATGSRLVSDGGGANLLRDMGNVLGNRCFGDDPDAAARFIAAFIKGVQSSGGATCPGFWPGAGNIGADPHVVTPVNPSSREVFETEVWLPFRAMVRERAGTIMSSHFATPALNGSETLPATISPEVTRILREELGYQGILQTDSMGMRGISGLHRPNEGAALAAKAGNDILMGTFANDAADHLAELVKNGEIPIEQVRASVRRILALKARLGLHDNRFVDLDAINRIVGTKEHQQSADRVAERSITLLRDEDRLVPFAKDLRVLCVTYEREGFPGSGESFDQTLKSGVKSVDSARLSPETEASEYDALLTRAAEADRVVLSVYIRPQIWVDAYEEISEAVQEFERRLRESGRAVVVLDFGKLNTLDALPHARTFVMAWSEQAVMQRAAARALLGETPIRGRLPLDLKPHHARGDGLDR